ncbi:MAG TPA: hypothetical protein DC049_19055 [Spirochaetia bacterium]|nr:hypothetical protein [Spirochaetia bacterium]
MGMILGQNVPLTLLKRLVLSNRLGQPLLFYGNDSTGKYESAVNLAKSVSCEKKPGAYCDQCASCRSINEYNNENFIPLTNDDRLLPVKFLIKIYKPSPVLYNELVSNISHIFYRMRAGFLPLLTSVKKTYAEGEVVSEEKLQEKIIPAAYRKFNLFRESKDVTHLDEEFVKNLAVVQNCLNRSFIPKSSLIKLQEYAGRIAGGLRIVIIQNIDMISGEHASTLLKILEEPPSRTLFILIVKNPQMIEPEVLLPLKSRCLMIKFSDLSEKQIKNIFLKKYQIEVDPGNLPDTREIMSGYINEDDPAGALCRAITDDFSAGKTIDPAMLAGPCRKARLLPPRLAKACLLELRSLLIKKEFPELCNSVKSDENRCPELQTGFFDIKRIVQRLDAFESESLRYNIPAESTMFALLVFLAATGKKLFN